VPIYFDVPPSPEELAEGIAEIRWRRGLFFGTWIAFCFLIVLLGMFVPDRYFIWVFLSLTILPVMAGFYAIDAECPRCRDTFFLRAGYSNIVAQHCLHCDLSLTSRRAVGE